MKYVVCYRNKKGDEIKSRVEHEEGDIFNIDRYLYDDDEYTLSSVMPEKNFYLKNIIRKLRSVFTRSTK